MDEQQKQTILDIPKVIAVGIASPVATLLTSRFGIAGTLIGLALSAVILTTLVDILKVYLARVPGAVTTIPGGFRKKTSWRNLLARLRQPFSKFLSLPPARRRSILIGSIAAAGISFFVGLSAVTALEVGVGKSLSCWVWNNCATESSVGEDGTAITSTLPSILGGGQSVSGRAIEVQLPPPQRPTAVPPPQTTPGAPRPPAQPGAAPSAEQPSVTQPGQRGSLSGVPEEAEQQSSSSEVMEEDEEQQSSSSEVTEEDERQNPSLDGSEEVPQKEEQSNQPASGSNRRTWEPPVHWAPWTT